MVFKELFEKYVLWTQTVFGGLQALVFFVAGSILYGLTVSNYQNIRFYFACESKGDYIKSQCIGDYSALEFHPLQTALLIPSISYFGPILIWLLAGFTTKILFMKYIKNGKQHPMSSTTKCFVCHIDSCYFIWLAVRLVFFLAMAVYYIFYSHKWGTQREYNCMASNRTTCTYSKARDRTLINIAYFSFNILFFFLAFLELVYLNYEKYHQQLPEDIALKKDSGCTRCKQFSKQHLIFLEDNDSSNENSEHLLSESEMGNNRNDIIDESRIDQTQINEDPIYRDSNTVDGIPDSTFKNKKTANDCQHNLQVALNEDAGAYNDLALKLDHCQYGGALKGVVELTTRMFDNKSRDRILSSVRGGSSPAMGFMMYMSRIHGTTLAKFKCYVDQVGIPKASSLIDQCIRKEQSPDTILLEEVDYNLLEEIAKCLSEKAEIPKNLQVTWKNVAGKANLTRETIQNLDIKRDQAREDLSLTEEMLTVLITKSPDYTVAELIEELKAIGRGDVVKDINLFKKCRTTCFE